MLMSSPIPRAAATCELSADHVRELLTACGYRNADVVSRKYVLPAGCGISLQFGEAMAGDGDGAPRASMRCNLALNGSEAHVGHARAWKAGKVVRMSAGDDHFSFAI